MAWHALDTVPMTIWLYGPAFVPMTVVPVINTKGMPVPCRRSSKLQGKLQLPR